MSKTFAKLADAGAYQIETTDKAGKVTVEKLAPEAAPAPKAIASTLGTVVRSHGAVRAACMAFLGMVFCHPTLAGYAGNGGDPTTGKLDKALKEQVRDAEHAAAAALVAEGHLKLPAHKNGPEGALKDWLSTLREDKNYTSVKGTVTKYFAFLGKQPVEDGFIVPLAVQALAVANYLKETMPQVEDAGSIASRVGKLFAEYNEENKTDVNMMRAILGQLQQFAQQIQEDLNECAASATAHRAAAVVVINKAAAAPALVAAPTTEPAPF